MSIPPSKPPGLRVLIIDDDPLIHRMLARALTASGHVVTCVDNVRLGMRTFVEGTFDAVVTDIYMPDQDGLDALRQLRAVRPEIPIIVLSGQLTDQFGLTLKAVVIKLGAIAAIPKDTNVHRVVEVLDGLAAQRTQGPEERPLAVSPTGTDDGT